MIYLALLLDLVGDGKFELEYNTGDSQILYLMDGFVQEAVLLTLRPTLIWMQKHTKHQIEKSKGKLFILNLNSGLGYAVDIMRIVSEDLRHAPMYIVFA